jgi:ENTS family enterobactin (siderophore) exporter
VSAAELERPAAIPSGSLAGYRRVFRHRRFGWYFASQTAGDAGYAVYAIAIPWLALRISGSLAVAGVVLGVEFGVYALSFLAGPVVDRAKDLRTILLLGYPAQGALALLLGYLAATGSLTVPVLLVLVVALSWLWDFTWTASSSIPPKIVGPDDLFPANALLSAVSGGNQVAGYAAGAALILFLSPSAGPVLYGVLNFVAAACSIPVVVPQSGAARAWFRQLLEGLRAFVDGGGRPLVALGTFSAAEAFFSAGPPLLILAVANAHLAGGAITYGILFTAFAVGTVVGSVALGATNPRARLGSLLILGAAAEGGLVVASVVAAPLGAYAAPLWFAVGATDILFYQGVLVYLQATTPSDLVGRTLTNHYLFRGTGRAAGAVVLGALLVALPVLTVGWVDGAAYLVVASGFALIAPQLRRLAF